MRLPEILQERTEEGRRVAQVQEGVKLDGLPVPGRAALLSLFPGLGQLYNGELGKGLLFLAVSISNLVILAMLLFPVPVLKGFTDIAALFNYKSALDIAQTSQIVQQGRLAVFLYGGLIAMFVAYAVREARDHAIAIRRGRKQTRFLLTMPEATSGSYLFHFAALITLVVMLVLYVTPPASREQTTDIELVADEPPPKPPEPKKKPDPPKPKVIEPKAEKPRTVKPPEPKPTPVAIAVPTTEPTELVQSNEPAPEPAEAPVAQTGSQGAGEPGGGGGGDGDGEEMDFSSYLAEVQKRVKKTWFPPRGNESKTVTLKFKIKKDGTVGTIKLVASSGLAIVDQAAQTAVKNASPYPPLPAGSPEEIDIKFTFDYNVFNGKGG